MSIPTALPRAGLRVVAAALSVAVVGCLGTSAAAVAAAPGLDAEEQAVCQQINAYRASKGLSALKVSSRLTRAANWMSLDMAAHDYLDHTDSRGRGSFARIRTFGVRGAMIGENLAAGSGDAAGTVNQWKADAPHRRTMLRASFKVIGIGRASAAGSMFGSYWTTTFGGGRERGVAC